MMRMKKKHGKKRILSLLLAVALCIGMIPFSAASRNNAAAAETFNYLALGDSITTGYGLTDPDTEGFVALLAAEIGADATDNEGQKGMTTETLAEVLTSLEQSSAQYAAIQSADVITITIGGNDLMTSFYGFIAEMYNKAYSPATELKADDVKAIFSSPTSYQTEFQALLALMISNDYSETLKLSSAFQNEVASYVANIHAIAEKIHNINSDAVIVVANQYNPYQWLGATYSNIINLFDTGVSYYNEELSSNDYTVADVYSAFAASGNTALTNADASTLNLDFHPNAAGHEVIADVMEQAYDIAAEIYTWEIPIELTVKEGGSVSAPAQDFEVEILDWNEDVVDIEDIGGRVIRNSVETDGAGVYTATLKFKGDNTTEEQLSDGFFVKLSDGGADGWTYDDKVYYVIVRFDDGVPDETEVYDYVDNEYILTDAAFECTYTPADTGYTLRFETNGGSAVSSVSGVKGTIDLTNYTTTRTGYTFDGWYADKNLTTKISSITLTSDRTVYAGWKEITYTWEIPVELTVKEGGSATAPAQDFELEILDLDGEVLDIEGEELGGSITADIVSTDGADTCEAVLEFTGGYDLYQALGSGFSVKLSDGSADGWTYDETTYYVIVSFTEAGESDAIEIYDTEENLLEAAAFECTYTGYTLTFDTNGGSAVSSISAAAGSLISLRGITSTRSGYTFTGWYTDSELQASATALILNRDRTVYAGWEGSAYTWEIPIDLAVKEGGSVTAPAQDFQLEILDLNGETLDIEGEELGGSITADLVSTDGADTYEAVLDFSGGYDLYQALSGGFYVKLASGSADGWTYDETEYLVYIYFEDDEVSRYIYATDENGNFDEEENLEAAAFECTYTGYTLRFETNNGSAVDSIAAVSGSLISLTDYTTTRDGYTFTGWYLDSELQTEVTEVTLNDDTTVYAGWEENAYTWEIPVELTVSEGGSVTAPEEDFELEILDLDGEALDIEGEALGGSITSYIVSTDGADTYEAVLDFSGGYDLYQALSGGFYVKLASGSADGWTYDETEYLVYIYFEDDEVSRYIYATDENGNFDEEENLEAAAFECTYTGYTLRFETNNGSAVDSIAAVSGSLISLTDYTTTRDGYTFTGWYLDSSLETAVTEVTLNNDTTVYAGWEEEAAEPMSYLAVGDNISAGDGLSDADTECFIALFADAIDADGAVVEAQLDLTAANLALALQFIGQSGSYYQEIAAADVITVTIGQNDLMTALYAFAAELYNDEYGTDLDASDIEALISDPGSSVSALLQANQLLKLLNNEDHSDALEASEAYQTAVAAIVANINSIVSKINEINPDAVVLVANQYNPYLWLSNCDNIISLFDTGASCFNQVLSDNKSANYTIADVYTAFSESEDALTDASVDFSIAQFEFTYLPNADGHEVFAQAMQTAYAAATAEYTWEIPIELTVDEDGSGVASTQTFALEILDPETEESLDIETEELGGTVVAKTVSTNGIGTYTGTLSFTGNYALYELLSDGFYVRLADGSADGWTYDDTVYYVNVYFDGGEAYESEIYEADDYQNSENPALLDEAAFTCTYTGWTLSFVTNEGSSVDSVTAAEGTTIALSDYVTVRVGYVFSGWYADRALKTGVTYIKLNEDTTVYAGWDEDDIYLQSGEVDTYLALGDSISLGYGLSQPTVQGCVTLFSGAINAKTTINSSAYGMTSGLLLSGMEAGTYNDNIRAANVVTVTVSTEDVMNAMCLEIAGIYNDNNTTGSYLTGSAVKSMLTNTGNPEINTYSLIQTFSDSGDGDFGDAYDLLVMLNTMDFSSQLAASETFRAAVNDSVANINSIAAKIKAVNPDAVILITNQVNPYQWQIGCDNIVKLFATGISIYNNALAGAATSDYRLVDIYSAFSAYQVSLSNANINLYTLDFDFDYHPNAAGHQLIASLLLSEYAKETNVYTWEVPVEFTVDTGGSAEAPEQTFELELLDAEGNVLDPEDLGITVGVNTVDTDGAGTYNVTLDFTGNIDVLQELGEGFRVRLSDDGTDGWTFDKTEYYVNVSFDAEYQIEEIVICEVVDGDYDTENSLEAAAFTCTYTGWSLYFETGEGTQIGSVTAVDGTTVSLDVYTTTRSGYTFTGWYADSAWTTSVTEVTLAEDVTVYAGWEEIICTWEIPVELTVAKGGSASAPEQDFKLEILDPEGNTIDIESDELGGTIVTNTAGTDGADTYIVTLSFTGGYDVYQALCDGFYVKLAGGSADGWTFDKTEYYVNVFFDEEYQIGKIVICEVIDGDYDTENSLEAAAFTCTYTGWSLYFETGEGTQIGSVTAVDGTTVSLDVYTTTRSGYTFTGWYADSAWTTSITDVTLTGDVTVYAGWEANSEDENPDDSDTGNETGDPDDTGDENPDASDTGSETEDPDDTGDESSTDNGTDTDDGTDTNSTDSDTDSTDSDTDSTDSDTDSTTSDTTDTTDTTTSTTSGSTNAKTGDDIPVAGYLIMLAAAAAAFLAVLEKRRKRRA
ncbi:MAG: InlB B-repeat-containing protein [Clostridiales bacterium]|nr:InlB B-repeat-containing protein [Clostridiales bacterium]